MTTVLRGPGTTFENLHTLNRFLATRGWVIDDHGHPELSYPANGDDTPDPEDGWRYPASYGGVTMNWVPDTTPSPLHCWFRRDFESPAPLTLVAASAGNYAGCDDHDEQEYLFEFDHGHALDLGHLGAVLDDLEIHARELDPRALIECRFFGPCGLE